MGRIGNSRLKTIPCNFDPAVSLLALSSLRKYRLSRSIAEKKGDDIEDQNHDERMNVISVYTNDSDSVPFR